MSGDQLGKVEKRMQPERLIKGMKNAILMNVLPKTTIEKILLRRHNPGYINKSIVLAICRDGVTPKDDWRKKYTG